MTVKTSAMPPLLILVGREGKKGGRGGGERRKREGEGRVQALTSEILNMHIRT